MMNCIEIMIWFKIQYNNGTCLMSIVLHLKIITTAMDWNACYSHIN